jgi:very-short-patch-repair endonuclease
VVRNSKTQEQFVHEKISELRLKLLDLSNRNALLNFRHSEKALTHVRIIDELPDFLFGTFLDGHKLTFKSLPEPDDEPPDEKIEAFQIALQEATLTDEKYLEAVAALIDTDDCFDDLAVIERDLKNRVREWLGMPPVANLKPLSNAQWARENGLEPKYDLLMPSSEDEEQADKHCDHYIQTLLKPKELQHKLGGIRRYITTDINETGVNTLYAAFGFLERYDSDHSSKPFIAPLVLLQLDPPIENKTPDGQLEISVKASGEDPQYNLPLAEKLKEFGLQLPALDSDDMPESYMYKVERLIKKQKRWRVRRFITIGRFQFARLVMYHDLDPDRWPREGGLGNSELITGLIVGGTEGSGSDVATEYDIDTDPDVEAAAPILIMEADSSQHSAIVDALKGKNLVIKGPPGTGKSQTITNLIANALAKDKKVLFIAEKMAALNVVHSRLQSTGLGDYCLELHSTKAKLKDIKEGLAATIENRKSVTRPVNLNKRIEEIKEAQARLREYSDVINQTYGESGKTIQDILWGEQSRRDMVETLPVSIKKIRLEDAFSFSDQKLQSLCDELRQLAGLEAKNDKYNQGRHPWSGVKVTRASSLKAAEIIQAFEECSDALDTLQEHIDLLQVDFEWTAKQSIADWRRACEACERIRSRKDTLVDFDLLKRLKSEEVLASSADLLDSLEAYDQAMAEIKAHVKEPAVFIEKTGQVAEFCEEAEALEIEAITAEGITEQIARQRSLIRQLEDVSGPFTRIAAGIFGPSDSDLNLHSVRLLLKAVGFVSNIDRKALFLRDEQAMSEASQPIIVTAAGQQQILKEQQEDLEQRFDLHYVIPLKDLDDAICELSTINILSYFRPSYYRSWKTYRTIAISPDKTTAGETANHLRALKSYREQKASFEQDRRFEQAAGTAFNGLQTDFSGLLKINEWAVQVRKEFSRLDTQENQVRQFLLSADVADIEAIREESAGIDPDRLLDRLDRAHTLSLTDFIAGLKSILERKERLHEFLQDNQTHDHLTFSTLKGVIHGAVGNATERQAHIYDRARMFSYRLGDIFDSLETDRSMLKETIGLSKWVEALELPDTLDSSVYAPTLYAFADYLFGRLHTLTAQLDRGESCIITAQEISELDVKDYTGAAAIQDVPIAHWSQAIETSLNNKEALNAQMSLGAFLDTVQSRPYAALLDAMKSNNLGYRNAASIFEYLYYRTICHEALGENSVLDIQGPVSLEEVRERFRTLDREIIELNCRELAYNLAQSQPPEGNSKGRVSEYTEMGLIRHQALKEKSRAIPIRKLMNRAGRALQTLKPCFLMSPLSVAQYIDPKGIKFDMVVIDEASQMRPEDALGAIGRSSQIVVVGDPKQLPPTAFFSKQTFRDDDYDDEDKIDNESILDLSLGRFRPTRDLLWHYRSRHESLIVFSNAQFYDNRLIVFPSPEDSSENFGVHYHYVGGTYHASCNIEETKAVVNAARQFMHNHPDKSLGIATMNSPQRDLIYEEMYRLFGNDDIAEAYRQKWEDTLEPFFVKNLESVQGDERDAIFVSTVYGPDKNGTVMQRFGPINGKFGHRRLNVLFTRAKHNLVLFTSLRPNDIKVTETSALGLRAFKGYLEYASEGKLDAGSITGKEPDSDFEIWVKEKLETIGCEVVPQVGVAGYFIDLGVKHPEHPYGFLMGIECDGAMYHSSKSSRDRDRIRQDVLEGLGWEIYRIWSTDWFHNSDREFARLKKHIEQALQRKKTERETREQDRLSNVVALQQKVQNDLFSGREEEDSRGSVRRAIAEPAEIPKPSNDNFVELHDTVSFRFIDD